MKKIIILILTLLLIPLNAIAEELPPRGIGIEITKKNSPIHWKYCEDYAKLLKQAFKTKTKEIQTERGWGASYDFIITKNGEIQDFEQTIYQNDYFDKIVKDIILSVKPIPFYEGMNEDSILVSIYLGYQRYNEVKICIGSTDFKHNERDIYMLLIDLKK
jgi:hypothetical protein|nr:MAG TPA: TolA C-terminal [Caudoviricetes sp.]